MNQFSFNEAIEALQEGKCIARKEWNEGVFAFKQLPNTVPIENVKRMTSFPVAAKQIFRERGKDLDFVHNLLQVYPDNTLFGWTPSVSDIMANDWFVC